MSVLVSAGGGSAYVQIIEAERSAAATPVQVTTDEETVPRKVPADSAARLLEQGYMVLRDLDFATGTSDLGPGPFASLDGLAEVLAARPDLRIAMVGHTDSVGGLAPNIDLSRQRAEAVRRRLISAYGVSANRLEAEGIAYLSPIASNATAEGRNANRRVEAVIVDQD